MSGIRAKMKRPKIDYLFEIENIWKQKKIMELEEIVNLWRDFQGKKLLFFFFFKFTELIDH